MESLRGNVPTGVLIAHDQMKSKGKRSVAEVRNGVCSGCHLTQAVGNVHGLKSGSLHRCGNCGRFLYVVEEDEQENKPSPARREPTKPRRKPREESSATQGAKAR